MLSMRLPTAALRRHEAAFAVAQHEAAYPPLRAISSAPRCVPRALRRGGSRSSAHDSDEDDYPSAADENENRAAAGNMPQTATAGRRAATPPSTPKTPPRSPHTTAITASPAPLPTSSPSLSTVGTAACVAQYEALAVDLGAEMEERVLAPIHNWQRALREASKVCAFLQSANVALACLSTSPGTECQSSLKIETSLPFVANA